MPPAVAVAPPPPKPAAAAAVQRAYVATPAAIPKTGVKMEVKPTQNAAAALRRKKPRPTTKVELAEESTVPPKAPSTVISAETPAQPKVASLCRHETKATPPTPHTPVAPSPATARPEPLAKAAMPAPPVTSPAQEKEVEDEAQREERIRNWVQKMDDLEVKQKIDKIKNDPVFAQFEQYLRKEIFALEDDEELPEFGTSDEDEELVSFMLWSENEALKPSPDTALPDPNPRETAALAVADPRAATAALAVADPKAAPMPNPKRVSFAEEVTVYSAPLKPPAMHSPPPVSPPVPEATSPPTPPQSLGATAAAALTPPTAPAAALAPAAPPTPPTPTPTAPATKSPPSLPTPAPPATPASTSTVHTTSMVPAGTLAGQIQVHAPVSQWQCF